MTNYNDVDGGSKISFVYLDRTIAHEFTHAIMAAKINYFAYLPKFIVEGMAEVTHGIDDKRTASIMLLAKNDNSLLERTINLENEYTESDYSYAGGYMLMRYLARQAALDSLITTPQDITNNVDNTLVRGSRYADTIVNNGTNVMVHAGGDNDTITNNAATVNIYGDTGNDLVKSNGADTTVHGGSGNDTISLSSAAANNFIHYTAGDGNDVIYGFNADDTLEISDLNYATIKNESDLIVSLEAGEIILKDAANVNANINGIMDIFTEGDDVYENTSARKSSHY